MKPFRAPFLIALLLFAGVTIACRQPAQSAPTPAFHSALPEIVDRIAHSAAAIPADVLAARVAYDRPQHRAAPRAGHASLPLVMVAEQSQPPLPSAGEPTEPQQGDTSSHPTEPANCCCPPQPWPLPAMLVAPEREGKPDNDAGRADDEATKNGRLMAWLTGIIAFSTILQAVMAYFQNRNMWRTMEQTKAAAEATVKAADASVKQAALATKAAEIAENDRVIFAPIREGNAAANMAQTLKMAGRSAKAAERGARATERAWRLDQRPWVGPREITIVKFADAPEGGPFTAPFLIRLDLHNTGKTPAQNVSTMVNCGVDLTWGGRIAKLRLDRRDVTWESIGALGPGTVHSDWMLSKETDDPETLKILAGGGLLYAVWGIIGYTDQFGTPYWTSFYWRKPGPREDAPFCATGPFNEYT